MCYAIVHSRFYAADLRSSAEEVSCQITSPIAPISPPLGIELGPAQKIAEYTSHTDFLIAFFRCSVDTYPQAGLWMWARALATLPLP